MAVHVQVSPHPSAFFSALVFFALEPTKLQISSHFKRRTFTLRTVRSWNSAQASPNSSSSLITAPLERPVIRQVDLMEFPSTKARTICVRSALLRLFIMTIMLERINCVKHFVHFA